MLDDIRKRAETYLEGLAKDTPNSKVAADFVERFKADAEVREWALHVLALDLWAGLRPKNANRRRSIRRLLGEAIVQLRIDWHACTSADEITQLIVENERNANGHAAMARDLRKVRLAMRAFPGVNAGEAARLAGVKLDVLRYPAEAA